MSFTFPCTGCGKQYKADPSLVGKQIKCKQCGTVVRVPAPSRVATSSAASSPSAVAGANATSAAALPMARAASVLARTASSAAEDVTCPSCGALARIRPEWRGQTLECPACQRRFVVPTAAAGPSGDSRTADADAAFFTEDPIETVGGFTEVDEPPAPLAFDDELQDPSVSLPPPTRRAKRKKARVAVQFSEWVQGPGLWMLNGLGVAAIALVWTVIAFTVGEDSVVASVLSGVMLVVLAIVLPILLSIGAAVLRAACSVLRVDTPGFGRCTGIVFLVLEANWLLFLVAGQFVHPSDHENPDFAQALLGLLIGLGSACAASAFVFTQTLDVSFLKGVAIWLLQIVIAFVVAFVLGILLALLLPGLQMMRNRSVPVQQAPGAAGQPAPQLGFPGLAPAPNAATDDTVNLRISGLPNYDASEFVVERLRRITDRHGAWWRRGGGYNEQVLTIEFGPAQDPKAFAAKIDFGTVTRIKGRLIELDADRKLMAEVVKFPPRPRAAKASTVASTALAAPVGDPPAFLLALPGADSAVPSWAGQAMDNPFDVRQFLQSRAAPADNAAPLYLAALADFGTEMDFCFRITEWEARKPSVEALSAAITRLADEDRLRSGFVRLEPDVAAGQPVDDRWAAISSHPAFLVAVVLAAILTRVLGWLVD